MSCAGRLLCSVCLGLLLSPAQAPAQAAEEPVATQKQLQALKQQIEGLQRKIGQREETLERTQSELRRFDHQIAEVTAELERLGQRLGRLERQREDLGGEESRLLGALQARGTQIRALLQEQYRLGQQPAVQLILSQRDPQRLARMLRYYTRVSSGLAGQLEQFRQQLRQLEQTRGEIARTDTDLNATRTALVRRREELKQARAGQAEALAKLRHSQQQDRSKLARLRQDQEQLESVLAEIRRSLEKIRLQADGLQFSQRKGRLEWPVEGPVRRAFGSQDDTVSYQGLLIAAQAGTPVKAVHHGRVVFAHWLRGYGLVLILDHGGGYLTLYGHNDSLLREPGEWVGSGETIALAGNSGGNGEAGLYFAIRHQGRSLDPINWLGKR